MRQQTLLSAWLQYHPVICHPSLWAEVVDAFRQPVRKDTLILFFKLKLNGKQPQEPTILISRLLSTMLGTYMYVAGTRLNYHREKMECTEHNVIMRLWTFYHLKSDNACFDLLSHETYARHSTRWRIFWALITLTSPLVHLTLIKSICRSVSVLSVCQSVYQ